MYLEAAPCTQGGSDPGIELDSLANIDLNHLDYSTSVSMNAVVSPQFADLIVFPSLKPHEQLLFTPYNPQHAFLSQASYQFSQPTTPVNVPSPLNQPFEFDPNTGMSSSYSPVMDYGSHFPNQTYSGRNLPSIRLDTSFPPIGVSPAYLSGSSGTPSTFNTPIHGIRHISPFTNSPTSPLPQVNVSPLLHRNFLKLSSRPTGSPDESNNRQQRPSHGMGSCSGIPNCSWHSRPTEDV